MSKYRANPAEVHEEFRNIIDKLASCVSVDDVNDKLPYLAFKSELINHHNNLLSETLGTAIRKICKSIEFDEKLSKLHELENQNDEKAWRPETGEYDYLSIKGDQLSKQLKILKRNVEEVSTESSQLQNEVETMRSEIEKQHLKISIYFRDQTKK